MSDESNTRLIEFAINLADRLEDEAYLHDLEILVKDGDLEGVFELCKIMRQDSRLELI